MRQLKVAGVRFEAAQSYLGDFPGRQETNDDEATYGDFRGNFSKTLEHNQLGEVKPASYRSLLRALRRNRQSDYEAIRLDQTVRTRKLANPQGAYKIMMSGLDGQATRLRPAPAFASAETAAEMGEVYAKALLREVPFTDFGSNADIAWAVNALNAFSETVGPKQGGVVTPATVFRGETPGDLVGPYISQFLLRDIPYGPGVIEQRYVVPTAGVDFMTDYDNWLAVQRGGVPEALFKADPRYIYNGRALGEYVHVDVLFQAYFNAGLILLGLGAGVDTNNPYTTSTTQGGFVTFGGPDILDLLTKGATLSLTGAWYQKWLAHRRLRPEAYGGRLHNQIVGAKNYGLPAEIEGSDLVHEAFSRHGGYLLPMAYAEGSPTHPAYPAGHATVAGACATVLKAVFDEDFVLTENVQANANGTALIPYYDELTVGGEINKLANNVALGRDWAGVHYRSDGVDGLLVGEQQAIGMLQDFSRTYNEDFDGFQLTTFEGRPIRIKDGGVS